MAFAKTCKKLKLFLQISTAYVNGQRQGRIIEKPFRIGESIARENLEKENASTPLPTLDIEDEIRLALSSAEANGAKEMKELGLERARKYGWQDTYVFTKAMGETLLDSMRGDVPLVILRPGIIESTYRDPFPGWLEGNRMIDPIVSYYGKGHFSGFPGNPNVAVDVVPVDMVVNVALAALAKHGGSRKSEIKVCQVASSVANPLIYKDLANLFYQHFAKMPCLDSKGNAIQVKPFKFYNSVEDFLSQGWMKMEQAKNLASVYEPYPFYGGRFDNTSTHSLIESMSEEEKRDFRFDIGSIDWEDYIVNVHIPGPRRHVMKKGRL